MTQYIIKRLLAAIPTIFFVSVLIFCLMRLIPGDVVEKLAISEGGTAPPAELLEEAAPRAGPGSLMATSVQVLGAPATHSTTFAVLAAVRAADCCAATSVIRCARETQSTI